MPAGYSLDLRRRVRDAYLNQEVSQRQRKNLSVIGVLSLEGLIASMTIEGSTDSVVFPTSVESVLVPNL